MQGAAQRHSLAVSLGLKRPEAEACGRAQCLMLGLSCWRAAQRQKENRDRQQLDRTHQSGLTGYTNQQSQCKLGLSTGAFHKQPHQK